MLNFIKDSPKGSDSLILRCVFAMSNANYSVPQLTETVLELYETKIKDIRIIAPIISDLDFPKLKQFLPQLFSLNKQLIHDSLAKMFSSKCNFFILNQNLRLIIFHDLFIYILKILDMAI